MMMMTTKTLLAALAAMLAMCQAEVSLRQEQRAMKALVEYFTTDFEMTPPAVRLVFHDCFTSTCNACLNLAHPGNQGLGPISEALTAQHAALFPGENPPMSRADYWVLAGTVAMELTTVPMNSRKAGWQRRWLRRFLRHREVQGAGTTDVLGLPLVYGRTDAVGECPTVWERELPHPHVGLAPQLFEFRKIMTDSEFTALTGGGHALTGAFLGNSGFLGTYTPGEPFLFNNKYFELLREVEWKQVQLENGPRFWQWAPVEADKYDPSQFMLNSDIALLYDIDPFISQVCGPPGGGPDLSPCRHTTAVDECTTEAPTAPYVHEFASDYDKFIAEYRSGWTKLATLRPEGTTLGVAV